jgi:hypothetical protein
MNTWIKRSIAFVTTGAAALCLMGPTANAGNASFTNPLVVSTTVFAGCTITPGSLGTPNYTWTLPNYTSGQATNVTSSFPLDINCPGASATAPLNVSLALTGVVANGSVGFEMNSGSGNYLKYYLCDGPGVGGLTGGAACAGGSLATPPTNNITTAVNTPDSPYAIGAGGSDFTYTLNLMIPGTQTPTTGAYTQNITGTITF